MRLLKIIYAVLVGVTQIVCEYKICVRIIKPLQILSTLSSLCLFKE